MLYSFYDIDICEEYRSVLKIKCFLFWFCLLFSHQNPPLDMESVSDSCPNNFYYDGGKRSLLALPLILKEP